MRVQSIYTCQQCGAQSPRWLGRCPQCDAWESLVEERVQARPASLAGRPEAAPVPITQVAEQPPARLESGIGEFDRVLGGGLVPGSAVLVAGDPGIGKSTLLLQAINALAARYGKVLYISGEESPQQIRLRAQRIGRLSDELLLLAEIELAPMMEQLAAVAPKVVVVDSVQTVFDSDLESAAGTVGQIRQVAARLIRLAKREDFPVLLVGHVTKEGAIAGPKVLEHMVDTVLYLEGDRHSSYRLVRATKNRFGSTHELGIFEMRAEGMVEVANPSAAFMAERPVDRPGSTVTATMEGSRPLLVEVQALVSPASPFGMPRRSANGLDYQRACLMLAVLEKRVGLELSSQEVYLNVPGGIQVQEPAVDLAMAVAVASSLWERPVPAEMVVIGEVGLTGEVRRVSQLERRLAEAARLGFSKALAPPAGNGRGQIETVVVSDLEQAFEAAGLGRG